MCDERAILFNRMGADAQGLVHQVNLCVGMWWTV